jgi:hypothetical protein
MSERMNFRVGTMNSHGNGEVYVYFDNEEVYVYFDNEEEAFDYYTEQQDHEEEVWIEVLTDSGGYDSVRGMFICGSCGEHCKEYRYNDETDTDECVNCQTK